MPSLEVTFTGNAKPVIAEMNRMKAAMRQNINRSLADWVLTGNAPNPAGSVKVMKNALDEAAHSGFNLNGVLRESLVVLREVGRGNWARIPGSISLILQYAGVLKYLLNPIVGTVALIAGGIFLWSRHLRTSAEEAYNFSRSLTNVKGQFEQQADEIKRVSDNLKEANRSAEDFAKWLDKIGDKTIRPEQQADDEVRALREKLDLEKEVAKSQGANQQKEEAIDQAGRKQEEAIYTEALTKAQKELNASKLAAVDAENKLEAFEKSKRNGEDSLSNLEAQAKKMDEALSHMPQEERNLVASLRSFLAGTGPLPREVFWSTHMNDEGQESVADQRAQAQKLLEQHLGELFDVGGDGGKLKTSMATLEYAFADEATRAKIRTRDEEELSKTQRELENALTAAKDHTDKNNETVNVLTRKQADLQSEIASHDLYDRMLRGGARSSSELDANQRIGAYATAQRETPIVDLARQQVEQQKQTNVKLDRLIAKPHGGVPGYPN